MRGLLWFLSAVLLLWSTNGVKTSVDRMNYEEQHENIKRIVDKAIEEANKNYGKNHIDFYSVLSFDHSKQMVQVLLTATPCGSKANSVHRKDCEVSKDKRPLVSCVACGDKMNCTRLRETAKIQKYIDDCTGGEIHFHAGGAHSLASKGTTENNEQGYGCLGCI